MFINSMQSTKGTFRDERNTQKQRSAELVSRTAVLPDLDKENLGFLCLRMRR